MIYKAYILYPLMPDPPRGVLPQYLVASLESPSHPRHPRSCLALTSCQ